MIENTAFKVYIMWKLNSKSSHLQVSFAAIQAIIVSLFLIFKFDKKIASTFCIFAKKSLKIPKGQSD